MYLLKEDGIKKEEEEGERGGGEEVGVRKGHRD